MRTFAPGSQRAPSLQRSNCISHLLSQIPYKKVAREKVKLPERAKKGAYDDQAPLKGRNFVFGEVLTASNG